MSLKIKILLFSFLCISCISKEGIGKTQKESLYTLEIKPFNRNDAKKKVIKTKFFTRKEEILSPKSYKLTSFLIKKKELTHLSHILYNESNKNIKIHWEFNKKILNILHAGEKKFSRILKPNTTHSWKVIYKE